MLDTLTAPRDVDDFNTVPGARPDPGGFLPEARTGAREAAGHMKDLAERFAELRGGTDFRPGFAWLHEHGVHPGCCLYLTDMECDSYPEAAPPYPVAWVNWSPAGGPNREPWGERIDIGPA